ncbi:MAG: polynucleotide adenylyltransferase PcnB, partial [Treponema sp.]|nr:polynucleotide adenylyltransferase PcnB [Treponema sp.]
IIEEALDTDLFMALQPAATAMMYADKNFESAYMKSIKELDELVQKEADARLGKKLVFLIKDFIYTLTDWKKELENHSTQGELYTRTWTECRSFVLPMNPQRTELEYAIKSVLSDLGLHFRSKKGNKFSTEKEALTGDKNKPAKTAEKESGKKSSSKKRKRYSQKGKTSTQTFI